MAYCDVHQADDLQRPRDAARVFANRREMTLGHHERRHDAGAVAGVDAGFLDVLHDAADDHRARRVGHAVDVELEGVLEEAIDQHRTVMGDIHGAGHVAVERAGSRRRWPCRVRRARTTAGRRPDSRSARRLRALLRATPPCRSPAAVIPRSHSSCEKRCRSSARSMESGDVPRMETPASSSDSASFSGVCPPNCTTHETSPPALRSRSMTPSRLRTSAARSTDGRRCRSRSRRSPDCS